MSHPRISSKVSKPSDRGVLSGQNVKGPAVTNMRYWLEGFKVLIHDDDTLGELRHFERKQNRTWGAEVGFHDDLVMSLVWALNVLHKNIVEKHYIVEEKDPQGTPLKILNKFKYTLEDVKDEALDSIIETTKDYSNVPVCIFGRASYAVTPSKKRELEQRRGDQFDIFLFDNWRPL